MPPRHDPVSLGSPRFSTADHGGFLVTDAWFPAGTTLPAHFHDRTVLATTLGGRWDSVMRGRAYASQPGMVLSEPAGERHANHFSRAGARVVIIQPDHGREEILRPFARWLERPNHSSDHRVAALARRLTLEIRHPDGVSPLAIEALALEMLAVTTRGAGGRRVTTSRSSAPAWLVRVTEYMHAACRGPMRMADLARVAGVHPAHIAREFRRWHRMPPGAYVRRLRLEWSADRLASSDQPIAAIAADAGFADQSHFTRAFRTHAGVTPALFRQRLRQR